MITVSINLPDLEQRLRAAIAHYWNCLSEQSSKQTSGSADRGRRAAVTGGRQMDGMCKLVQLILTENGLAEASISIVRKQLQQPN